jgi:hypothetical protein
LCVFNSHPKELGFPWWLTRLRSPNIEVLKDVMKALFPGHSLDFAKFKTFAWGPLDAVARPLLAASI